MHTNRKIQFPSNHKMSIHLLAAGLLALALPSGSVWAADKPAGESMDKMWGQARVSGVGEATTRGPRFRAGHYGLFMHWGLYSQLAGQWKGKTYYGIGEWIMNPNMAGIPVAEYMDIAKTFNPERFDAKAIVALAKDAGMTSQYQAYPIGVLEIVKAGVHRIEVSLVDGERDEASLEAVILTLVQ